MKKNLKTQKEKQSLSNLLNNTNYSDIWITGVLSDTKVREGGKNYLKYNSWKYLMEIVTQVLKKFNES